MHKRSAGQLLFNSATVGEETASTTASTAPADATARAALPLGLLLFHLRLGRRGRRRLEPVAPLGYQEQPLPPVGRPHRAAVAQP